MKRIISCSLAVVLTFICMGFRLYGIINNPQYASTNSDIRVRDIADKRGNIYDRNGNRIVNREIDTVLLIKPDKTTYPIVTEEKGENFAKDTVLKGYFTILKIDGKHAKSIDNDNIKAIEVYNRYKSSPAVHLIGYTDIDGNGVCGIEKYYNDKIKKSDGNLKVAYSADAIGRMLVGEKTEIRDNNYYNSSGICLTIDINIQNIVEAALINGNITKGAAIVLDVETSAIIASASSPVYDRENLNRYLNDSSSPFLNRAFEAYPVGSVFKAVTTVASLENNIIPGNYNCCGYIEKSGNNFYCNNRTGHGEIDFTTAFSLSCNPYFIELGTQAGAEKLLKTAKDLGFGKSFDLGNGFLTPKGKLPDLKELNSDAAVGNLSFGQGKLTASPLQVANFYCTIANGGIFNKPYIFNGEFDNNGKFIPSIKETGIVKIKKQTCEQIKNAMLETTKTGTGKLAFSNMFDSCSKTATAQSGVFDENNNEIKYSWFVGFFPYEKPEYVVCIMKENGNSGGIDGAPVFKEICENIYKYENNSDIS